MLLGVSSYVQMLMLVFIQMPNPLKVVANEGGSFRGLQG